MKRHRSNRQCLVLYCHDNAILRACCYIQTVRHSGRYLQVVTACFYVFANSCEQKTGDSHRQDLQNAVQTTERWRVRFSSSSTGAGARTIKPTLLFTPTRKAVGKNSAETSFPAASAGNHQHQAAYE